MHLELPTSAEVNEDHNIQFGRISVFVGTIVGILIRVGMGVLVGILIGGGVIIVGGGGSLKK
jgi:hypothetical protein